MPEPRKIVPDGAVRAGLNSDSAEIPTHRIVVDDTLMDNVLLSTDPAVRPKGVTMEAIAVGVTGDVQTAGKAIVESGAAFSKGDRLVSDSVGRGVVAADADVWSIGVAARDAGGAGELIETEMGIDLIESLESGNFRDYGIVVHYESTGTTWDFVGGVQPAGVTITDVGVGVFRLTVAGAAEVTVLGQPVLELATPIAAGATGGVAKSAQVIARTATSVDIAIQSQQADDQLFDVLDLADDDLVHVGLRARFA